ncbi:MAG: DUF1553 domain-containing protein [Planctomycetota bacterium]|nr:MAG: DUF1553 domain-containing protein [Planctomycetota bacterium]
MRWLTSVALFMFAETILSGSLSADEQADHFEAKIRPVLAGTCFRCHGDSKTGGNLRIDSRQALLTGGDSGPAIVPGNPEESLLLKAITRKSDDVSAMPPEKDKALRADQLADFAQWIKEGAQWPETTAKFVGEKHWAYQPVKDVPLPTIADTTWPKTSIDYFIRARQEAAGVRPAPPADKPTLIRRATYDLTGLPPTAAEVDTFLKDTSTQAFETVVERLLQSPAYGEQWGRHWLDVVRYADTAGETADYPVPLAWRYRNYVVDSFNQDKPYDVFLREQIAGDILAAQGPPEKYAERVTATGYLAISRRFGFDSENYHHLTIQDTLDNLGQSVLGLSIGCVRCHDHKFDPISMQDYYGLYGIFDSSRYAFPGSEQKSKFRLMAPLIPVSDAQQKWRDFENRVAALSNSLSKLKQPVPGAVLRSLADMDGDFEMQAPAAGGSNGVLVPPWLYEGRIEVTTAAQSPFKNLYPLGKVGANVPAGTGVYRIAQSIRPRHTREDTEQISASLDFRIAAAGEGETAEHRFSLGALGASPAVELLISPTAVSLKNGETTEKLANVQATQWHNLQLVLNLKQGTWTGRLASTESASDLPVKPLSPQWNGVIDFVELTSTGTAESKSPAISYDNLGVQDAPIAPATTEPPSLAALAGGIDPAAITTQLQSLTGIDGDVELQTADQAPTTPWGAGPNSVVSVSANSQSPFENLFAPGTIGIHMPNRGEYDGFGQPLPNTKPDKDGHLFVAFDFRCASQDAGGNGSWRYYIGHGPGNSAAVELFFNGAEFFRRSGDAREPVAPLNIGQWYQVQLTLDVNAKTYIGVLASDDRKVDFSGQFATGWDGTLDHTFIDSYGHIGGVRPALDADNFFVSDTALRPFGETTPSPTSEAQVFRRNQIAALRQQLADIKDQAAKQTEELNVLLVNGPFEMTYGVTEGTPHNVRMQMRGEPSQPGVEVPRGFIQVLGGGPLGPQASGSGRLELAQWITQPENPLTARVMANRIWQYHFGRGLVKTPNDFGMRGMPPTHPELLDHLATQFVKNGWSIRAMHRLIMLSATYQLASDIPQDSAAPLHSADAHDLYAVFARRRLSAEEIRDSILDVSGDLDRVPGHEHPFPSPISWGYSQHGPFSAVYDHNKRSIYLMTQRLKRHPFLALFDGADPNASTADRLGTTVPTQALFFLNDPMIHAKSEHWATRIQSDGGDETQWIERAWLTAFGHAPNSSELADALEFLAAYRAELAANQLDNIPARSLAAYLRTLIGSNEFLHVD